MEKVTTLPSYTDRPPRATDVAGQTYNFVTTEEFRYCPNCGTQFDNCK